MKKYGARSAPKKDYDFPGEICISINDEIAHGIPDNRVIKKGDLVNIDVSAELDGYYADTGASILVSSDASEKSNIVNCAKEALYNSFKEIKSGNKMNQIGLAIEKTAHKRGLKVIRNLCGHGIGRQLHEEPQYILNYYDKNDNDTLKEGQVLAVETFISESDEYIVEGKNEWSLVTPNKSLGAQFEHTIIVTKDEPIILTI